MEKRGHEHLFSHYMDSKDVDIEMADNCYCWNDSHGNLALYRYFKDRLLSLSPTFLTFSDSEPKIILIFLSSGKKV